MNPNTNNLQKRYAEDEIDLLELAKALWKRAVILVLAFIIGFGGAGAATKLLITPTYRATSMIYVYGKTTSITSLADLQIGSQLTADFQVIAKTRPVMERVIDKMHLDYSVEQLKSMIAIGTPDNSRILSITVTSTDPQEAADISNAVSEEVRLEIAEVMVTDEPTLVEPAVKPLRKAGPNTGKNAMMGGMLLFILVAGIYTILFLMDDTIRTEDDVNKYLGYNVLASIPSKNRRNKKRK